MSRDVTSLLRGYHPPAKNVPFRVTFHMTTPISLAHPWINGDSLIAYLLMRDLLGEDFYTLPTKSPLNLPALLELPLKKSWNDPGVYHASVSLFDTDRKYLTTIYKRFDTEDLDHVTTRKSKIPRGMGFFKDCMIRLPLAPCRDVTFYYNGNLGECERLLRCVSHLGKDRDKGYGQVRGVDVEEMDEDYSLFRDGVAMRPIPYRYIRDRGIPTRMMTLAYTLPYWWRSNAEPCIVPGSGFAPTSEDGMLDVYSAVDGLAKPRQARA